MNQRGVALQVAFAYLGKWYKWGGDDPQGFDCSGLIVECLKSAHILPRGGDWSADALASMFASKPSTKSANDLRPGWLVFWGTAAKFTHIEMVYDNFGNGKAITIGASGGGSKTLTEADAIRDNAFIKIRPIRPGWALGLDPFEVP